MKKVITFITLAIFILSCSNKEYNKITIKDNGTTKCVSVEMYSINTIHFEVEKQVSDSIILQNIRIYTDSIKANNKHDDSLHHIDSSKLTKKVIMV